MKIKWLEDCFQTCCHNTVWQTLFTPSLGFKCSVYATVWGPCLWDSLDAWLDANQATPRLSIVLRRASAVPSTFIMYQFLSLFHRIHFTLFVFISDFPLTLHLKYVISLNRFILCESVPIYLYIREVRFTSFIPHVVKLFCN